MGDTTAGEDICLPPELEVIKDSPCCRVTLKAVLRYQIQQLLTQLSKYTEEESIILSACLSDGTFSYLGKTDRNKHKDVKRNFLNFCMQKLNGEAPSDKPVSSPSVSSDQPRGRCESQNGLRKDVSKSTDQAYGFAIQTSSTALSHLSPSPSSAISQHQPQSHITSVLNAAPVSVSGVGKVGSTSTDQAYGVTKQASSQAQSLSRASSSSASFQQQPQKQSTQLSEYTEDGNIKLSVCLSDETFDYLGTKSGKTYLDQHKELKINFLNYCMQMLNGKEPSDTPDPSPSVVPREGGSTSTGQSIQVSGNTEEGEIALSVCLSDGSFNYLGTKSDKTYLNKHQELKIDFLNFCMRKLNSSPNVTKTRPRGRRMSLEVPRKAGPKSFHQAFLATVHNSSTQSPSSGSPSSASSQKRTQGPIAHAPKAAPVSKLVQVQGKQKSVTNVNFLSSSTNLSMNPVVRLRRLSSNVTEGVRVKPYTILRLTRSKLSESQSLSLRKKSTYSESSSYQGENSDFPSRDNESSFRIISVRGAQHETEQTLSSFEPEVKIKEEVTGQSHTSEPENLMEEVTRQSHASEPEMRIKEEVNEQLHTSEPEVKINEKVTEQSYPSEPEVIMEVDETEQFIMAEPELMDSFHSPISSNIPAACIATMGLETPGSQRLCKSFSRDNIFSADAQYTTVGSTATEYSVARNSTGSLTANEYSVATPNSTGSLTATEYSVATRNSIGSLTAAQYLECPDTSTPKSPSKLAQVTCASLDGCLGDDKQCLRVDQDLLGADNKQVYTQGAYNQQLRAAYNQQYLGSHNKQMLRVDNQQLLRADNPQLLGVENQLEKSPRAECLDTSIVLKDVTIKMEENENDDNYVDMEADQPNDMKGDQQKSPDDVNIEPSTPSTELGEEQKENLDISDDDDSDYIPDASDNDDDDDDDDDDLGEEEDDYDVVEEEAKEDGKVASRTSQTGKARYLPCPFCGKHERGPAELTKHIRTHNMEKPYGCHICPMAFVCSSTLNQHLRYVHFSKD